jgi:hypothetical protein
MNILNSILKDGVSAVGASIGGLARDVRTAITGKEAITSEERLKILDNVSKMETLALQADQTINEGQMKINEIEAASPSLFKSGWRPATAWMCIAGFGYMVLLRPLLPWTLTVFGVSVPEMPEIDTAILIQLLAGLLGLGGFRTFEKVKGISSK